jgi:methionine-rich copper-binding protein CopC
MAVVRAGAALLWVVGAAGWLVVGAGPAAAHTFLVSSMPASGSELPEAPRVIELDFSHQVSDTVVSVSLASGQGALRLAPAVVSGPSVRASVVGAAPPGWYVISYSVTSADGHRLVGEINFVVRASTGETSGPDGALDLPDGVVTVPTSDARPAAEQSYGRALGDDGMLLVLGGGVMVGLVMIGAIFVGSGRR